MRFECIEFKRCCCCIPLRYGLLIIGYLKLVVSLILLTQFILELGKAIKQSIDLGHVTSQFYSTVAIFGILVLVMMLDTALAIVFVVGAHKKDAKLLKVYNYYSIGIFVLCTLAFVCCFGSDLYRFSQRIGFLHTLYILRLYVTFILINLGFQVYMILLTKSEIAKLENNCQFRFVNNANEAECTMDEEGSYTIGTSVKNNETLNEYETVNENEDNEQKEKLSRNGNYVKLVH